LGREALGGIVSDRDIADAESRARLVRITEPAAIAAVEAGELAGQIVGAFAYSYAIALEEWRQARSNSR